MRTYDIHEVTPAIETAEYDIGDVVFIPTEIPNFFRGANDSVEIKSLTVIDRSVNLPSMFVYLTNDSTTFGTINATAGGADSVIENVQCMIPALTTNFVGGANYSDNCAVACITKPDNGGIGCIVKSNNSRSIYITAILAAAAETFGSTGDLTFKIGVKYL